MSLAAVFVQGKMTTDRASRIMRRRLVLILCRVSITPSSDHAACQLFPGRACASTYLPAIDALVIAWQDCC
eukprot:6324542-Pyramimonas_sp.AAC.1